MTAGKNSVVMLAATTCLLFWSNSHDAFALSDIRARMFVTWFCMPPEIFYIHNFVLNRALSLPSETLDISVYSGIFLMMCLLSYLVQVVFLSAVFLVCLFSVSLQ
jgi:hypothetical protein